MDKLRILNLEEIDKLNQDEFNIYIGELTQYKYRYLSSKEPCIASAKIYIKTLPEWKRNILDGNFRLSNKNNNDY